MGKLCIANEEALLIVANCQISLVDGKDYPAFRRGSRSEREKGN